MKCLRSIFALFVMMGMVTTLSFATTPSSLVNNDPKEVEELRAAVEKAGESDWRVYSEAAKRCIELKTNLSEAYVWLNTALMIEENAYNMEIKGDYLALNGVKDMALEAYRKSMVMGMNTPDFDIKRVQKKMLKVIKR